jgi:hypothetical protein
VPKMSAKLLTHTETAPILNMLQAVMWQARQ